MPAIQKVLEESLDALMKEAADLDVAVPARFQTNEGRLLFTLYRRLLETVRHGKPTTELPSRHHK